MGLQRYFWQGLTLSMCSGLACSVVGLVPHGWGLAGVVRENTWLWMVTMQMPK